MLHVLSVKFVLCVLHVQYARCVLYVLYCMYGVYCMYCTYNMCCVYCMCRMYCMNNLYCMLSACCTYRVGLGKVCVSLGERVVNLNEFMGSVSCRFGVGLGWVWGKFPDCLGSVWDRFGCVKLVATCVKLLPI